MCVHCSLRLWHLKKNTWVTWERNWPNLKYSSWTGHLDVQWSDDKHFKLKVLFYSLRNQVMKIMTTNHISDKCIFPYVNNKSLLWRTWHVSNQQSITVFSLCSECASSHPGSGQFPLRFHTIKMFTRLFMSLPNVHAWGYISNDFCLWGRSSHIYQIQSLCYASCRLRHLLIIYTKAVHTYSRLEPVSEGMCT